MTEHGEDAQGAGTTDAAPESVEAAGIARHDVKTWLSRVNPRAVVRGAFFVFFVYLCVKLWMFYLWSIGAGPYVARPEAVAGIIPVGAYMSLFAWMKSGVYDPVIPAGVTILLGAMLLSLLFKRGFCGWVCPVGAFWEFFGWAGDRMLPRQPHAPRILDLVLRGLRYVLTALVLSWIFLVSVQEALSFQQLPYYAVADIKIISLFVRLPWWYVAFGATIAAGSFFFGNIWCRYICPLGGLYGAIGVFSPTTVVRDDDKCIDCGRCTKSCHALVDVQRLGSVHAPECDGCQDCVVVCPAPGALEGRLLAKWRISPWVWAAAVVALWLLVYGIAVASGHWNSPLSPEQFKAAVQSVTI
jgi:polyferredoxin